MRKHGGPLRPRQRSSRALFLVFALFTAPLTAIVGQSSPASAAGISQLAAGGQTNCVVESDGNAYCWGNNTYGELGNGTTTSSNTPQLVLGGYDWASISVQDHAAGTTGETCGITVTGAGYCWGDGRYGNGGDGTATQRLTPSPIAGGYTWTQIVVGFAAACGITTTHDAYCWGYNADGELGNGTNNQQNSPALVSGSHLWSNISIQNETTCAVTTANAGYCWGLNDNSQLGNGLTGGSYNTPQAVSGAYSWARITSGGYHSCGVTTTNVGYCWGGNYDYELGNGTGGTGTDSNVPVAVSGGYSWSTINAGWAFTCGITTSNVSYCWGYNNDGQLGNGNTGTDGQTPTVVSGGLTFASILVGSYYTGGADDTVCGLTNAGTVYCWGYNNLGQIGDGGTTNQNVPTLAKYIPTGGAESNVSVTIIPTFTFAVNGQSSGTTCDGLVASTVATTSTAVSFGNLAAGARSFGTQQLQVTTNAGGGYKIWMASASGTTPALKGSNGHSIADSGLSVNLPAAGNEFFGYAGDSSTNGVPAGHISTVTSGVSNSIDVGDSFANPSYLNCVEFAVGASVTTPADSYSSTIIYTAVPTF